VAIISLFSFTGIAGATEKTASVEGVVTKVDLEAKTLEVKAADGTEHIMRLAKRTVVHGERESSKRGDDAVRIFGKRTRWWCTIPNMAQTRPLKKSIRLAGMG
jgi:hypothetical protein